MNPSIDALKASDGSGNASVATVQSTRAPLATTISVDTVSGINTNFIGTMGTPHTFEDPVTGEEITVISEATAVDFKGHVDGGDIEIDEIAPGYTDLGSEVGDIIIIKPTTQWSDNLAAALEVAHNDDGSLKAVTANPGWTAITGTTISVATGYNKTNKSYELNTSTDLTGILSPGMRFKFGTSGFTVPTQSTDLEASSSQYWSKTSPSGISFTDDFTCEAWVKLESYGAISGIVARRNADTEGWSLEILDTGQLKIGALRIAANNKAAVTAQSIPLGRWVHVAATLDCSGSVATTYIDGVSVPNTITTNGTITALVQGTTALVVGAQKSAGTSPFDGKIADVRVWSAVRTATEIQDNMSKVLTGSETNLVAHFPMNGNGNDSTANANNLTGQAGAVATSADNPYNQNSGTNYGIITKVTTTAITVFTGTDSFVPNATLINPYYSTERAPFGFPAGRDKWYVESIYSYQEIPTLSTSYVACASKLITPIGAWSLSHNTFLVATHDSTTSGTVLNYTLSSDASTETHPDISSGIISDMPGSGTGTLSMGGTLSRSTNINLSAITTFTGLVKGNNTAASLVIYGDVVKTLVKAECAYL